MIALGVDTHKHTHTAMAADSLGCVLGQVDIENSQAGYGQLLQWSCQFGEDLCFGIEGTGSYGAGLCEYLTDKGMTVYEVEQPKRKSRRKGKSDSIDALLATRAVLSDEGLSKPRAKGKRELLRALLLTHNSCTGERTRLIGQLDSLLVCAPNRLRQEIPQKRGKVLVAKLLTASCEGALGQTEEGIFELMKDTARRICRLEQEIKVYFKQIEQAVKVARQALLEETGVGPISAAKLLVVDVKRFGTEAKFARANGTAPIPASSGQSLRQRLNRGGDRQANNAIHIIALARRRFDPESKRYFEKKLAEGKTKREAMRSLKRKVSKRLYKELLLAT